MARLTRDTVDYNEFGKKLDQLCKERKFSFHQLAIASGMSSNSHATIIRACRGKSVPRRESILAWCNVLEATAEQRTFLLHFFHYTTPEEENDQCKTLQDTQISSLNEVDL